MLYANCWEDADLLLAALNPGPDDEILAIGSAGDSCFSLLSRNPKVIYAYDLSMPQLHLIELKKAAFRKLDYPDLLAFLGETPADDRAEVFTDVLLPALRPEAASFWKARLDLIRRGVLSAGRLEGYFATYRRYVQPLLASQRTIREFFAGPATPAQLARYRRKLANPLLAALMKFFFSRPVMSLSGRTPAFFSEVEENVGGYLFGRFRSFVENPESYDNPYIHRLATGHFGPYLPHYLRPESFAAIRANLERMVVRRGYLRDGLRRHPEATLVHASDIFEYMPREAFRAFGQQLSTSLPALKRIAYWNLMVDRSLAEEFPRFFRSLELDWDRRDRLFFYKRFVLEGPRKEGD